MNWKGEKNPNYKGLDKILSKEFLYQEYIINKKSTLQIARENNCGKKRISYYLKVFGILIRSMNQAAKNRLLNPKNHSGWNGGVANEGHGYILIHSPNHPFKKKNNYVLEHRLIMESWLRKNKPNSKYLIEVNKIKYLRPETVVHHKGIKYAIGSNENKRDNRIKNLQPFKTNAEHIKFHNKRIK